MTISEKELQGFTQQKLAEASQDPSLILPKLTEVVQWGFENALDDSGKAYLDKLMETLAAMIEAGLEGAPDTPEKRKLLRGIALVRRKHHSAENFLRGLGRALQKPILVAEAAKPIFLSTLQAVLDLLFDATRKPQRGAGQFACLSMLYWAVDELSVAFYLSERKYTTQAFGHLRTVHDLLDRAEVFHKQPELAEIWGGTDKKKILKELSPGSVRVKLGKPRFDSVYDFLTERGAHGTFTAVQKRTTQKLDADGNRSVAIRLGGTAFDGEVDVAVSACIVTALGALMRAAVIYRERLNEAETASVLVARAVATRDFLKANFPEFLKRHGRKMDESIEELIRTGVVPQKGETQQGV